MESFYYFQRTYKLSKASIQLYYLLEKYGVFNRFQTFSFIKYVSTFRGLFESCPQKSSKTIGWNDLLDILGWDK